MKTRKIKIPQYLVRGKHRDFHVLVFPKLEHAWAYYEFDYQRYEIDGGYETYLWLKCAMAALIASPDRILYFPVRQAIQSTRLSQPRCRIHAPGAAIPPQ